MDCSTFSNRTGVDDTTVGDESAVALRRQLETALRSCEVTQQELHEARRNYQTALDVQHHLVSELETLRAGDERRTTELRAKITTLQEEVQTLRAEQATTADVHAQRTEALESKIGDLQEQLSFKALEEKHPEEKNTNGVNDELVALKNGRDSLLTCVSEQKINIEEKVAVIATLKERLTELDEKVLWSNGALQHKKEELASVVEALHSAQSELALANSQLQMMRSEGGHAAKGNSLFAEVEDKRQEMAKTLIQMKQHNAQLKRELANKQAEVDTLLCEKRTLWEEVTGLSGALDEDMIKSYERHITELSTTVEQQRRDLMLWYNKYFEPGSSQSAEWVAGVLTNLKNRCERLTDSLLEISVDNMSKASQIRELHKKVASLRLKACEAGAGASVQSDTRHQTQHIVVEVPPQISKQEIKIEIQNKAHENTNMTDESKSIIPKREKTAKDVKKKVMF